MPPWAPGASGHKSGVLLTRPLTGALVPPLRVKSTPLGQPVKQPGTAQRMTRTSSGREGPNTGGVGCGSLPGCWAAGLAPGTAGSATTPHGCRFNLPPSAPEHTRTSQLGGYLGAPSRSLPGGRNAPGSGGTRAPYAPRFLLFPSGGRSFFVGTVGTNRKNARKSLSPLKKSVPTCTGDKPFLSGDSGDK
jgi:hypothetical protein